MFAIAPLATILALAVTASAYGVSTPEKLELVSVRPSPTTSSLSPCGWGVGILSHSIFSEFGQNEY